MHQVKKCGIDSKDNILVCILALLRQLTLSERKLLSTNMNVQKRGFKQKKLGYDLVKLGYNDQGYILLLAITNNALQMLWISTT